MIYVDTDVYYFPIMNPLFTFLQGIHNMLRKSGTTRQKDITTSVMQDQPIGYRDHIGTGMTVDILRIRNRS